jgi:hypothetical protein
MRSEHTWIWTEACSSGSAGGRLGGGVEGAGSRSGEGTPPRAARVRVPGENLRWRRGRGTFQPLGLGAIY